MTLPTQDWFLVVLYAMFWAVRINGCVRRGRQPLLRGREWFFNVRVQGGFYDGPGKAILRQYWLRMMIPFAVDIPWAIAIFRSGQLFQLNFLVLATSALIHANHLFSVRIAERQARAYAVKESERPAARLALSLAPRRLRDYTNPVFEGVLAVLTVSSLIFLVGYYLASPPHVSARIVFGAPLFMLYTQAGMLIIKRAAIAWPSPVPTEHAEEHMHASEERRRYYVRLWDWSRAASVASLVMWPVLISLPGAAGNRALAIWLGACLVAGVVATVLGEIKRKQIAALAARAMPVLLPDLLASGGAGWPVCYQPSAPVLMLKSARGYSLNLGNSIAQFTAAYVAGFAVLVFVLTRMAP